VAPFFTPEWGDIPAKRWCIHPRAKPVPARRSALAFLHAGVTFCCRGSGSGLSSNPAWFFSGWLSKIQQQIFP
jgi:hypothetical protein